MQHHQKVRLVVVQIPKAHTAHAKHQSTGEICRNWIDYNERNES